MKAILNMGSEKVNSYAGPDLKTILHLKNETRTLMKMDLDSFTGQATTYYPNGSKYVGSYKVTPDFVLIEQNSGQRKMIKFATIELGLT